MSHSYVAWVAVAAAVVGNGAVPTAMHEAEDSARAAATAEPEEKPCFSAWASPLYQGVGWTHFVDVINDCDFTIDCDVATTVDPLPVHPIRVAPGEIVRVRTRYGSNTWVFEPIVACWPTEP